MYDIMDLLIPIKQIRTHQYKNFYVSTIYEKIIGVYETAIILKKKNKVEVFLLHRGRWKLPALYKHYKTFQALKNDITLFSVIASPYHPKNEGELLKVHEPTMLDITNPKTQYAKAKKDKVVSLKDYVR